MKFFVHLLNPQQGQSGFWYWVLHGEWSDPEGVWSVGETSAACKVRCFTFEKLIQGKLIQVFTNGNKVFPRAVCSEMFHPVYAHGTVAIGNKDDSPWKKDTAVCELKPGDVLALKITENPRVKTT